MADALTIVAAGGMPGIAKPLKGFGSGVLELALRHRGDAVWVLNAFQKKSRSGIKTPREGVDLVHERLKRLKEMLR